MEALSTVDLVGKPVSALPAARRRTPEEALASSSAAQEFEEVFLRQLLDQMLPKEGTFFGEKSGAHFFKDFFVGSIAESMAQRGALGIKEIIAREIDRMGVEE